MPFFTKHTEGLLGAVDEFVSRLARVLARSAVTLRILCFLPPGLPPVASCCLPLSRPYEFCALPDQNFLVLYHYRGCLIKHNVSYLSSLKRRPRDHARRPYSRVSVASSRVGSDSPGGPIRVEWNGEKVDQRLVRGCSTILLEELLYNLIQNSEGFCPGVVVSGLGG